MPYRTYIDLAIGFIICSFAALMVSWFWHPHFEGLIAIPPDITIGDVIYYNGANVSRLFVYLSGYYLSCVVSVSHPKSVSVMIVRYLSLFLSGVTFVRMCFEFFYYNHYTPYELGLHVCVLGFVIAKVIIWYLNLKQHDRTGLN